MYSRPVAAVMTNNTSSDVGHWRIQTSGKMNSDKLLIIFLRNLSFVGNDDQLDLSSASRGAEIAQTE